MTWLGNRRLKLRVDGQAASKRLVFSFVLAALSLITTFSIYRQRLDSSRGLIANI